MPRIDRAKLKREIELKIGRDNEPRFRTRAFAERVRHHWATVEAPTPGPEHPYSQGGPAGYAESIHIRQNRNPLGRFMFGYKVFTDHPNAVFIEDGTGVDKPGSRSPWGPNTPTPAMHPAAKTAHHFGGTP